MSVIRKLVKVTMRVLRSTVVPNSMDSTPQAGCERFCTVREAANRAESFLKSVQESTWGWKRVSLALPSVYWRGQPVSAAATSCGTEQARNTNERITGMRYLIVSPSFQFGSWPRYRFRRG